MTTQQSFTVGRDAAWNAGLLHEDGTLAPAAPDRPGHANFLYDGWAYDMNFDVPIDGQSLIARACDLFSNSGEYGVTWDECVQGALFALPEGQTSPFTRISESTEPPGVAPPGMPTPQATPQATATKAAAKEPAKK